MRVEPPTRIRQGLLHRRAGALDQVARELLEPRPGERRRQVLGPRLVGGDKRQADLGLGRGRELDLRPLGGLVQALERLGVLAQIDPLVAAELLREVIHDPLVEVVAAEVAVAVGGAHLDHALAQLEDRDVEGPATQVEHEDGLLARLVEPVGERCGGGLVDDPEHLEAGDPPGVLGGLTLGVVEVGRYGDNRLGDPLAEILAGIVRQLAEHLRRDLLRRVLLATDLEADRVVGAPDDLVGDDLRLLVDLAPLAPDEALRRVDRALRVEDGLALGHLAD
jgi:hypothetical protein